MTNLEHLKQCEKACRKIFDLMTQPVEDEHGNMSPYRWDKVHKEILNTLEDVGYKREWVYDIPWKVAR